MELSFAFCILILCSEVSTDLFTWVIICVLAPVKSSDIFEIEF